MDYRSYGYHVCTQENILNIIWKFILKENTSLNEEKKKGFGEYSNENTCLE